MGRDDSNWKHALFTLGLALFCVHELDAVARHEWRLLPLFNLLEDGHARRLFILAHIPIFALLFWLTGHKSMSIRRRSQIAVDLFLIGHGLAHFIMHGHPAYEFKPPIETITVYGGVLIGGLHLIMLYRKPKTNLD